MNLLSIITLPAVLVGFAHASVHATPHASPHTSAHTSSHVSSHSSVHTSSKSGSTSKGSSSKSNSSKKSNPSGKNTDAKNSSSSSYPSFFPWWGTSNHKEKNDVDQIKKEIKWLKVEEVSELLKLFFNTSEKKQIETEIYVKNNEIIVESEGKRVLYDENDNKNKHIYIRRYINCLIELYQSESYKHILQSRKDVFKVFKNSSLKEADYFFKGIDSEEKAKEKLNESDLADYMSNKINLGSSDHLYEDLTKRLINYHEAINNFSEIIGIYLKIEWDKAKEGK